MHNTQQWGEFEQKSQQIKWHSPLKNQTPPLQVFLSRDPYYVYLMGGGKKAIQSILA